MPFYPIKRYTFIFDDCGVSDYFRSHKDARRHGWAVSKDYRKCYCPFCAAAHRNTGRNGVRRRTPFRA